MLKVKEIYNESTREDYISKSYMKAELERQIRIKEQVMDEYLERGEISNAGIVRRSIREWLDAAATFGIIPNEIAKAKKEEIEEYCNKRADEIIQRYITE